MFYDVPCPHLANTCQLLELVSPLAPGSRRPGVLASRCPVAAMDMALVAAAARPDEMAAKFSAIVSIHRLVGVHPKIADTLP